MESINGWAPEPALIDPALPVARRSPDLLGQRMTYWPSYSSIHPECRAAYLGWLQSGRADPGAGIGYVFLYFYGLERRIIVDGQAWPEARAEIPRLRTEVERLHGIYGRNHSFHGYAQNLLGTMAILYPEVGAASTSDDNDRTWELPIWLRVALGRIVAAGDPLPAALALAWYRHQPYASLRTPAQRCPQEFAKLFALKYAARFGTGMKVRSPKRQLELEYRAASTSFGGVWRLGSSGLPDVSELTGPVNKLGALAEECCDELDPYSRFVGRSGAGRDTIAGIILLPSSLLDKADGRTAPLRSWLHASIGQADHVQIDAAELIRYYCGDGARRLASAEVARLLAFLGTLGYGIEPDVRSGGSPLAAGQPAVLFRTDPTAPGVGDAYQGAKVVAELAAAVALADGGVSDQEWQHLDAWLHQLPLAEPERRRLGAYLRWVELARPGMAGLAKRVDLVPATQRSALGELLVTIAGADGHVAPAEVDLLKRAYRLLGLDAGSVYSAIHALGATAATGPVTVRPAHPARAYGLPSPAWGPGPADTFTLDMAIVAAKLRDTERVASLLGAVFAEKQEAPTVEQVAGMDEAHSLLLRALAAKDRWPRSEYVALVRHHGLMPEGALETINDAAYERAGAPVLDDGDPLTLDPGVLKEMLA